MINIDVKLLAVQKLVLTEIMFESLWPDQREALEGVISLLDAVQHELEDKFEINIQRSTVDSENRKGVEL